MAKNNAKLNIKTIPYLTRRHFEEIVRNASTWDFNRQLSRRDIRELPNDAQCLYPVNQYLFHQHRRFQLCEPHMRLVIDVPDSIAIADVPMDYFEKLPRAMKVYQGNAIAFVLFLNASGKPTEIRYVELNRKVRRAMQKFAQKHKDARIKKFIQDHLTLVVAAQI